MKTKIIDAQVLGGGEASCSPPSLPMGSACHNTFYTQVLLESIHSLSISRDGPILSLPIFKFLFTVSNQSMAGKSSKMSGFIWESFPKCVNPPTHPRVFVRFGKTKGELRVKKGVFRGDFEELLGVWTLFGNQLPHPPTFGKTFKKKRFF